MALANRIADRSAIRALAKRLVVECGETIHFGAKFAKLSALTCEAVDTDGWYVSLASFPGQRGLELQVWFDNYPNAGERRASVCLKATHIDLIEKAAKIGASVLGRSRDVDESIMEGKKGIYLMRERLPAGDYGKPVAELYANSPWKFYTVFFRQPLRKRPDSKLFADVLYVTNHLARLAIGLPPQGDPTSVYPEIPNRKKVRTHTIRERSQRLALRAKVRDNFTCLICRINFADLYGRIGAGMAEAHHVVHLSDPKFKGATNLADLRNRRRSAA
jgi:hypothetical protein